MNLLRLAGTSFRRPVVDDRDGKIAGIHVEHWDDHVDAHAHPRIARIGHPPGGFILPDGRRILEAEHLPRGSRLHRLHHEERGVFASSGLYLLTWIDALDATQLAIDLSLTSHKWAMYTNTLTPNFSADSAYSATNEVSGTGYTAGGQVIVAPTVTESPAGSLMYDMSDQVWASPTSVTARGAILYADALAGNNLIVAVTFGSDFTSTAGTFTIQWAATGVVVWDLTP